MARERHQRLQRAARIHKGRGKGVAKLMGVCVVETGLGGRRGKLSSQPQADIRRP